MFDLGARFEWLHLPPEVSRALDLPAVRDREAAQRCSRCDWLCAAGERACANCGLSLIAARDAQRGERVQLDDPEVVTVSVGSLANDARALPLAEPDVVRALIELETARAAPSPDHLATLGDFPHAVYEHQARCAARVIASMPRGALLADAPGLGKTVEAAVILRELRARGQCRRALIVCAPGAVRRWQDELAMHAGERLDELARPDDVAGHALAIVSLAKLSRAPLRNALASVQWDLLIIDDAHTLGSASSSRYQSLRGLNRGRTLLLTAEPARDGLDSLHALAELIRPGALGTLRQFRRAHVRRDDPRAPRERAELREALAAITVRSDRADARNALPDRAVGRCGFELTAAEHALAATLSRWAAAARHRAEHSPPLRALLADLEARARSSSAAVATAADDAAGRAGLPVALRDAAASIAREARALSGEARVNALLDVLAAAPSRGPVALFTRFAETASALGTALSSAGRVAIVATSSTRASEIERVRAGKGVLVCVDGSDVDLPGISLAVHYDLPSRHADLDRRVARVQRLGAQGVFTEVFLCAGGTADETIQRALTSGDAGESVDALDRMLAELERESVLAQRVVRAWHRGARDDAAAHSVESHREGVSLPVGVHAGVRSTREGSG